MDECHCLKCSKKLAEISRRTVYGFVYSEICSCGREVIGKISVNKDKGQIIVSLDCVCGYRKELIVGHLVSIKCKRCKTISTF